MLALKQRSTCSDTRRGDARRAAPLAAPGCDGTLPDDHTAIEDGATITPCSYLPKDTRIPARGVWGGNPVRDLRAERREERAKLHAEVPGTPSA